MRGETAFRSSQRYARDIAERCAGPAGTTFPAAAVSRTRGTKCRLRPTLPSPAASDVANTALASETHRRPRTVLDQGHGHVKTIVHAGGDPLAGLRERFPQTLASAGCSTTSASPS